MAETNARNRAENHEMIISGHYIVVFCSTKQTSKQIVRCQNASEMHVPDIHVNSIKQCMIAITVQQWQTRTMYAASQDISKR